MTIKAASYWQHLRDSAAGESVRRRTRERGRGGGRIAAKEEPRKLAMMRTLWAAFARKSGECVFCQALLLLLLFL